MGRGIEKAREQVLGRLPDEGRLPRERARLASLVGLFATRRLPGGLAGTFPRFADLQARLAESVADASHSPDTLEERFLEAYAYLHGHELPYDAEERAVVDMRGGYWAHAGGLTPILRAPDWLRDDSIGVDFGAAHGLQGLLMQWLRPHRRFVQVEISRKALETGRELQAWLGIPHGRVEWRAQDVCEAAWDAADFDFVYLYRPVRPEGPGLVFYERLGVALAGRERPTTVFSIADCLRPFLGEHFEVTYDDGQLSCFHAGGRAPGPGAG